ncbi:PAS domain S-box protein [Metabacillus fastidiosus]|uniref:PAS domain S-box protein n=1 Tax=Metabacillus fastidiosus TaxID=1458 RepID=UPI002E1CACAF|nr:PAS domain S-box protein [Metabacillus fastidiosus]
MTTLANKLTQEIESFQSLIKYSKDIISRHTLDGKFIFLSNAVTTLLGYTPDELVGHSCLDYCHPYDHNKILDFHKLKYKTVIFRIRRKQGDYIWLETSHIPIDTSQNTNQEYLCVSRNTTQQKILEEEMKEEKEKYRLLVEDAECTIGIMTSEGIWIYINNSAKNLFGMVTKNEGMGQSIYYFIHPDNHDMIKEFVKKNERTEFFNIKLIRCDQKIRDAEMKMIPTIYNDRCTFQVIMRDITEKKKNEERLQQIEKLSVIGHLAAGFAHEIRNPLTSVKGLIKLLQEDEKNKYFQVVMSELQQIEDVVNDWLVLGKTQELQIKNINLQKLIENIIALLNPEAKLYNIKIISKIELLDPYIEGDSSRLKQIFVNFILNAIEAMPKGGEIFINVKPSEIDKFITIKIIDKGVGIPDDRISKLGEPFYSTKEKGTGLGLMICNRIINTHRGTMNISSKIDQGTTVTITLPSKQE